jgi:hypothetical protein
LSSRCSVAVVVTAKCWLHSRSLLRTKVYGSRGFPAATLDLMKTTFVDEPETLTKTINDNVATQE